jgi:hypothetical protein
MVRPISNPMPDRTAAPPRTPSAPPPRAAEATEAAEAAGRGEAPAPTSALPRAHRCSAPPSARPTTLLGRLRELLRIQHRHDPAVAGALIGLTAIPAAIAPAPAYAADPAAVGIPPGSLFNARGIGNVSGQDHLFDVLGDGANDPGRSPHLSSSAGVADPSTVMTVNTPTSGAESIRQIVQGHLGAPRTAEVVAAKLAELYGPYTAQNSAANRAAIIENLRWIGDSATGVHYNTAREKSIHLTTQPPNVTLSTGSGVCRDVHTALSAILASLINAHRAGNRWLPGPPTGQEANVQTIGFDNPSEYHAYMVFRDPATGYWNALEYGKSYALQSADALDAFRSLPGYVSGDIRWAITGWNSSPVVVDRGAIGAAKPRAFFHLDPGVGTPGELRLLAGNQGATAAGFITPRLSIVGSLSPNDLRDGVDGGLKLNYHRDFESGALVGYTRVTGGVYTSSFDASVDTGQRALAARAPYRTWIIGVEADGRYETRPQQFIGEHLVGRIGGDFDALLGVPLALSGPKASVVNYLPGALDDSDLRLALDGMLSGREHLSERLTLDWALRLRYDADLINAALELVTSGGTEAKTLGLDPLQTDFALALTYRAEALTLRFEAGGTGYWATPFDPQTTPEMTDHAVLTVTPRSGVVSFGILARGEVLNGSCDPVDSIGVALNLNPSPRLTLGTGVLVSPDGVTVNGNLGLRF